MENKYYSKSKNNNFKNSKNKSNPNKTFNTNKKEHQNFKKPKSEFTLKEEVTNVRFYVYQCLYNIYYKKAFSNIEIDHIIRESNMNDLDKKLFTNIVYGTLHHHRLLSWEIRKLCEKSPKDEAKIILLMSLYQLKFLDKIPPFAILNEAVGLAKKIGNDAMGKFVNAILRESLRQNLNFSIQDAKDEYEYLSIIYNMPIWVIKMWEIHYGKEKTLSILKTNMEEPPLSLRVNIQKCKKEDFANHVDFIEGKLAKNSLIYVGKDPILTKSEIKNGLLSIQDESSQLVVEVLDPKENEKILDMCAAPGSKTQYIAQLMNQTGKVLAIDIHQHRVEIMKSYLDSLQIKNVTCVCFDSTLLHSKEKLLNSFDKVLLDAPCLGLGVIRRKPDILLNLNSEDLDEICALQQKLLEEAYLMLKPKGTLLYSTCSINKKENDSQITSFLAKHSDMKRIYEKQLFPDEFNSDGFYICKMIKE